jgi:outer membrane protein W
MLRKLFALPVLGLAAVAALPSAAQAQEYGFDAGSWELTLAGQGSNDRDFESTSFGVNGSLGYFLTDNFEVALRQMLTYTDAVGAGADGSAWNGQTVVALDYHFDLGRWQPFIGANIGYAYGDSTTDTFIAGPEAGVKYFVTQSAFIQLMAQYEFFFDEDDVDSEAFSNGAFFYSLGIGLKI